MADLINLKRPYATQKNNVGGLQQTVLVARMDKFATIAGFVSPVVNPEDAVTISGDHTFGLTDGFTELEGDFKKNTFEGEKSGDWGSNNKKWTIKAFFYGTGKEAAAAELEYNNAEVMLLTKKIVGNGAPVVNQFGLKDVPARCIDAKWTSGTPDSGFAGIEFTFEAFQPSLAYYEGVVTLKP